MRFHKTGSLCWVFVLAFFAQAARAELDENDHFDHEDIEVRDVGPEMGVLFHPFLFRGPGEVLGNSNRGGTFTTRNRGERWRRSMRGLLNSAGVEAFDFITCQARSARSVLYAATIEDGLFRSDDFADRWVRLAPLPAPRLVSCDVDPGNPAVVYALTDGTDPAFQLFKSTDAGRSFAVVGSGLPPDDFPLQVSVAPTSPQTVYVVDLGAFQGLYVSHDGGLRFARIETAPDFPNTVIPSPTDDGTLFLVAFDGLYRSVNGGATFSKVLFGAFADDVSFDPLDRSIVYAAAEQDGLFRSLDSGATFAPFGNVRADQLGPRGAHTIGVQATGRRRTFYLNTGRGNFRSDDEAQSFVPIARGYRGAQVSDVAFDAAGRLLVPVVNTAGLFRAVRPGRYEIAGEALPDDAEIQVVAVAASPDDPDAYVVMTIAGIFRTVDGGASWTQSNPVRVGSAGRSAFAPGDGQRVYAVGSSGLFWSLDGGASFAQTFSVQFGSVAVDPRDADVVYMGTWTANRGVFKSSDGGRTLQLTGLRTGNFAALAVDPQNTQILYAGHRAGSVFRSLDGGATFAPAGSGLAGAGVMGLGIDPRNPARLYAWMHNGGLFRSDDRAITWSAVDTRESLRRSGLSAGRGGLAIDPTQPGHVLLGNRSVIEIDLGAD
jgi:photosystem II stability/assembly factor-like uncharacterized protein